MATQADGGINTGEAGGMWPLAGQIKENNFADHEIAKQLVDPSGLDFRPVEGGSLTRGPEIIGPYQENFIILRDIIDGTFHFFTTLGTTGRLPVKLLDSWQTFVCRFQVLSSLNH